MCNCPSAAHNFAFTVPPPLSVLALRRPSERASELVGESTQVFLPVSDVLLRGNIFRSPAGRVVNKP